MPRLPPDEIDRLKASVFLVSLIKAAGVALEAHGKDLLGLRPFHDDHEPSIVVTPDKSLWHCLGTCRTGDSVIDWVMKWNGVGFRLLMRFLKEKTGAHSRPRRARPPHRRSFWAQHHRGMAATATHPLRPASHAVTKPSQDRSAGIAAAMDGSPETRCPAPA